MGCFNAHSIRQGSHISETEARLWTQSSDANSQGSQDVEYLRYKIWSDYDMCTSKCRDKLRHKGIDTMHIGVKLLCEHSGTPQGYLTKRFPSPNVNDIRKRSIEKV